jgi:hypothetical protein
MNFTVTSSSGETTPYSGDVSYKIDPGNGVLTITAEKKEIHFAPQAWRSVEEEKDPDDGPSVYHV